MRRAPPATLDVSRIPGFGAPPPRRRGWFEPDLFDLVLLLAAGAALIVATLLLFPGA